MKDLIQQAWSGDRQAQESLLGVLRPRIRLQAERALNVRYFARSDASDLAQDLLLSIWDEIQRAVGQGGAPPKDFFAWVERALANDIRDAIRRATAQRRSIDREESLEDSHGGGQPARERLSDDTSTPSQKILCQEQTGLLDKAIEELPARQAQAIRLRYVERLKVSEIAAHMAETEANVYKLIQRGMAQLKKKVSR